MRRGSTRPSRQHRQHRDLGDARQRRHEERARQRLPVLVHADRPVAQDLGRAAAERRRGRVDALVGDDIARRGEVEERPLQRGRQDRAEGQVPVVDGGERPAGAHEGEVLRVGQRRLRFVVEDRRQAVEARDLVGHGEVGDEAVLRAERRGRGPAASAGRAPASSTAALPPYRSPSAVIEERMGSDRQQFAATTTPIDDGSGGGEARRHRGRDDRADDDRPAARSRACRRSCGGAREQGDAGGERDGDADARSPRRRGASRASTPSPQAIARPKLVTQRKRSGPRNALPPGRR